MIRYTTISEQFSFLLCNRFARTWKSASREFLHVIGTHRQYLMEAPELHKQIPARKPCVTDVLWNV